MTYVTMQQLRERGWNDRQVKLYLGNHDVAPMGIQKPGRPERQFLLSRVITVEQTIPKFAVEQERKKDYAERIKISNQTKLNFMTDSINEMTIPDLTYPYEQLLADSADRANLYGIPVERVALDTLLDKLKSMDANLDLYQWHSGVREARILLKQKILTHIVAHYPELEKVVELEAETVRGGMCK